MKVLNSKPSQNTRNLNPPIQDKNINKINHDKMNGQTILLKKQSIGNNETHSHIDKISKNMVLGDKIQISNKCKLKQLQQLDKMNKKQNLLKIPFSSVINKIQNNQQLKKNLLNDFEAKRQSINLIQNKLNIIDKVQKNKANSIALNKIVYKNQLEHKYIVDKKINQILQNKRKSLSQRVPMPIIQKQNRFDDYFQVHFQHQIYIKKNSEQRKMSYKLNTQSNQRQSKLKSQPNQRQDKLECQQNQGQSKDLDKKQQKDKKINIISSKPYLNQHSFIIRKKANSHELNTHTNSANRYKNDNITKANNEMSNKLQDFVYFNKNQQKTMEKSSIPLKIINRKIKCLKTKARITDRLKINPFSQNGSYQSIQMVPKSKQNKNDKNQLILERKRSSTQLKQNKNIQNLNLNQDNFDQPIKLNDKVESQIIQKMSHKNIVQLPQQNNNSLLVNIDICQSKILQDQQKQNSKNTILKITNKVKTQQHDLQTKIRSQSNYRQKIQTNHRKQLVNNYKQKFAQKYALEQQKNQYLALQQKQTSQKMFIVSQLATQVYETKKQYQKAKYQQQITKYQQQKTKYQQQRIQNKQQRIQNKQQRIQNKQQIVKNQQKLKQKKSNKANKFSYRSIKQYYQNFHKDHQNFDKEQNDSKLYSKSKFRQNFVEKNQTLKKKQKQGLCFIRKINWTGSKRKLDSQRRPPHKHQDLLTNIFDQQIEKITMSKQNVCFQNDQMPSDQNWIFEDPGISMIAKKQKKIGSINQKLTTLQNGCDLGNFDSVFSTEKFSTEYINNLEDGPLESLQQLYYQLKSFKNIRATNNQIEQQIEI